MNQTLKKIQLDNLHRTLGAKMVEFAGYEMPLKYGSLIEEHLCVRNGVGMFDVSHMGEFKVVGPGSLELIQKVSANDAASLKAGQAQYSYLPNDQGGIVDDLLVYKFDADKYMLVVNASNIEKDFNWIKKHNTFGATLEDYSELFSLFAVQGPKATEALQSLTTIDLSEIKFYHFSLGEIAGISNVIISATGYTGSGGFELYVPNTHAESLWNAVMEAGKSFGIQPIGLGARDTLRLEKGYCLYGNDINDHTSPIAAGLSWVTKFNKDFINKDGILADKENKTADRLVAFKMVDKGIPRKDYKILDSTGGPIGTVTSGGHSPSLDQGIGLGYVKREHAKKGTDILIQIRKKQLSATIVKLPFV
jgi:aminomethyltransferase